MKQKRVVCFSSALLIKINAKSDIRVANYGDQHEFDALKKVSSCPTLKKIKSLSSICLITKKMAIHIFIIYFLRSSTQSTFS